MTRPIKPGISMRAWRAGLPRRGLPDGHSPKLEIFVVDRGPSKEKVVSGLVAELCQEPWSDPHDYVLIDTDGTIKEKFTVTTWSIEEELGASVFAVADGALRNLSVSVFYSAPVRVKRVEKTVVDGLQAVAPDDDETLRFLSGALSRHEQMLADEAERQTLAVAARVTAIPGAGDEYGVGDDFRRAQELLRSRVAEELDGAMLGALARFGMLHRMIRSTLSKTALPVFTAALDSFVIACRLAAFDRSLGRVDHDPPQAQQDFRSLAHLSTYNQAEVSKLEQTLGTLERDLLQCAEQQERSDARNNAIQMRAAAAYVARAREHLEPQNASAYNARGSAKSFKNLDGAIADYGRAIELDPRYVLAYYNRGLAKRSKDLDGAIADYGHAIELDPGHVLAYYNRGLAKRDKGDLDGAIADYNEVLHINPQDARTYNDRGDAWRNKGDYDRAIADYTRAIELDPRHVLAYYNRGLAKRDKGDLDGAIADYSRMIETYPQSPTAYYNRGYAWADKRDYDRAIADFEQALRINPQYVNAHHRAAWLLATAPVAAVRNGARAVDLARKAAELSDWNEFYLGTLAAAYAEAGNFAEAVRWQEKALESPAYVENYGEEGRRRLELYRKGQPYRDPPPTP